MCKVCDLCGNEHDGRDGDNRCPDCEAIDEMPRPVAVRAVTRAKRNRAAYAEIMRSMGLVRVTGALGGVYWE